MFKKFTLILLAALMLLLCGCGNKTPSLDVDKNEDEEIVEPVVEEEKYAINPLTGVKDLEIGKEKERPVAITVNNLELAQKVQTGVGKADIVYETEVEAGITRLVAVYQDIEKIEKIGTVRSARYAFVDLAMGHNAIYVHHGQDVKYAASHLNDCDHFTVSEKAGGARISNGLAREHTLYAYGDKLWQALKSAGIETENSDSSSWQTFSEENVSVKHSDLASKVTVPFSNSYKTSFVYDSESGKYIRYSNGTERKDYNTGENLKFKNVIVLNTAISDYPDNYHRNVNLTSGDGYYFVNGTYTVIKWSKGNASSKFKFTDANGSNITLNQGNTWVCIASKTNSQPVIE